MDFIVTATTDVGIRKKVNQDRMFAGRMETPNGVVAFAVLCDGMGGLEKGEIASSVLVRAFSQWISKFGEELNDIAIEDCVIREQWTAVVEEINAWILEYSRENGCRMGTTVTVLFLTSRRYYLLNIGDTRAYEVSPFGMRQLTVDHTLVQREVELGNLTRKQAESAPMGNVLTRCVGIEAEVYPDLFFGKPKEGAVYLLCSDGFRHRVAEEEIIAQLFGGDGERCMESRQEALVELVKERGETDNISVITIQCRDFEERGNERFNAQ